MLVLSKQEANERGETHMNVKDGKRIIQFDGRLIASSTSDDGNVQRWTDLNLYLTTSGKYVVEKIGQSAVYHDPDATCTKEGKLVSAEEAVKATAEDEALIPCIKCNPHDIYGIAAGDVIVEQPRYSAVVCEQPEGVLSYLEGRDSNGTRYLSNVARRLLELASDNDKGVAGVYRVTRI